MSNNGVTLSIWVRAGAVSRGHGGAPSEISAPLWPPKKFKIRLSLAKILAKVIKLALY